MTDLGFLKGKKVCVAVSGGLDSVCLLHKMKQEEKTVGFFLSAVHVEHGIRGEESLRDCLFTEELCKRTGIPLKVVRVDCPLRAKQCGESIETAARVLRRSVFSEILSNGEADYIATAHHSADEAETILFRLIRGTSLTGVRGMSEIDGKYLKPLLKESKAELAEYAKRENLSWREDSTNAMRDATRNKLRLDVLPMLEDCFRGAANNLIRFSELAGEDDAFLYRMSEALIYSVERDNGADSGLRVRLSKEKPLFRRACLSVLKSLGVEKDYTFDSLERVFALQTSQTGKIVSFSNGVYARRQYDSIAFFKDGDEKNEIEYEVVFSSESQEGEGRTLKADADKFPDTAIVRFYREGDTFKRFGGGSKPLKKYFIDEKIPQGRRRALPLIAEADGHTVYVVCGVEISDLVAVDEKTKNIRYIVLRKKGE